MRRPGVDLSLCIRCGICVDVCPQVFTWSGSGFVAVAELDANPVVEVDEATTR